MNNYSLQTEQNASTREVIHYTLMNSEMGPIT